MRTNYNINSRSAEQESTCNFKGIEFYEVGVNTRHAHAETELDKSAALPITGQVKKSLWSAVSSLLSRTKFMMIERWLGSQGFMGEDFLKTTSKGDNSRLFSLKNKFRLDHKYSRSHVVKILNNLSKQNNRFYYDLLFMQDERSTGFVKTIFCMKVISTLLFLRQELIHNLANEFGLEHHDPSFKMNYEDTVQDYDIDQNYDFETLWDNKIRVLDERIKTARYYSSHGFSNACLDESNQQTALKKLLNEKKIVEKNADLFRVIYDFQSIIVAYQSSFSNLDPSDKAKFDNVISVLVMTSFFGSLKNLRLNSNDGFNRDCVEEKYDPQFSRLHTASTKETCEGSNEALEKEQNYSFEQDDGDNDDDDVLPPTYMRAASEGSSEVFKWKQNPSLEHDFIATKKTEYITEDDLRELAKRHLHEGGESELSSFTTKHLDTRKNLRIIYREVERLISDSIIRLGSLMVFELSCENGGTVLTMRPLTPDYYEDKSENSIGIKLVEGFFKTIDQSNNSVKICFQQMTQGGSKFREFDCNGKIVSLAITPNDRKLLKRKSEEFERSNSPTR